MLAAGKMPKKEAVQEYSHFSHTKGWILTGKVCHQRQSNFVKDAGEVNMEESNKIKKNRINSQLL
jgi:hypothetical protein